MRLCGVLKVGPLDYGVDWACLLAKAAVNAFGHINVVPGCSPRPVRPDFCFDGDGLRGANSLTELACDAALIPGGVSSESVFSSKPGGDRPLFEWVIQGDLLLPEHCGGELHGPDELGHKQRLDCSGED